MGIPNESLPVLLPCTHMTMTFLSTTLYCTATTILLSSVADISAPHTVSTRDQQGFSLSILYSIYRVGFLKRGEGDLIDAKNYNNEFRIKLKFMNGLSVCPSNYNNKTPAASSLLSSSRISIHNDAGNSRPVISTVRIIEL